MSKIYATLIFLAIKEGMNEKVGFKCTNVYTKPQRNLVKNKTRCFDNKQNRVYNNYRDSPTGGIVGTSPKCVDFKKRPRLPRWAVFHFTF